VSVDIKITGDTQTIASLQRIGTAMINEVVIPELDLWATDIHGGFLKREHQWDGNMRASTKKVGSREKLEVRVDVSYAEKENRRGGNKERGKGTGHGTPHGFVEPTLAEQNPKHFDALVNKVDRFIKSN